MASKKKKRGRPVVKSFAKAPRSGSAIRKSGKRTGKRVRTTIKLKKPPLILLSKRYCVSSGDLVWNANAEAFISKTSPGLTLFSADEAANILAGLKASAAETGIDGGISAAAVKPAREVFALQYAVTDNLHVDVQVVAKDEAVNFKTALRQAKSDVKNDVTAAKAIAKNAAKALTFCEKRLAKFEKWAARYV